MTNSETDTATNSTAATNSGQGWSEDRFPSIVGATSDSIVREADDSVTHIVSTRTELADRRGNLRLGVLAMVVDGAGGLAGLFGTRPGTAVVTTDLNIQMFAPVQAGKLAVHGTVLRAGATNVVCSVELHDEGGNLVGVGAVNNHSLETAAAPDNDYWPVGETQPASMHREEFDSLADHIQMTATPGEVAGSIDIPVTSAVKNPWDIMHGGVITVGVDEAVLSHPDCITGWPASMITRYLSPIRVGPARFVPTFLGRSSSGATFRVDVFDVGLDNRLTSVSTVVVNE